MDEDTVFNDRNKSEKPPFNCHMTRFQLPINESENNHTQIIKQLIGGSGRYFIHLTETGKLRYIWYDRDHKCIDIWGQESKIEKCKKKIELKVYKILLNMKENKYLLNDNTLHWMDAYTRNFKKF